MIMRARYALAVVLLHPVAAENDPPPPCFTRRKLLCTLALPDIQETVQLPGLPGRIRLPGLPGRNLLPGKPGSLQLPGGRTDIPLLPCISRSYSSCAAMDSSLS